MGLLATDPIRHAVRPCPYWLAAATCSELRDVNGRIPPEAGWVRPGQLARGPGGRACCRRCGAEVPKGRRSFCGDTCVHEWKVRTDPGYARKIVFERDGGVCVACGLDTEQIKRAFRAAMVEATGDSGWWCYSIAVGLHQHVPAAIETVGRLRALGFGRTDHFWEMDHIVPVVEGGGGCGLENLRTLCRPCHLGSTKALRGRLARGRKAGQ